MGEPAKALSAAASLPLPRKIGRRVLLKLAARGGMGDVYLAATLGIEGAERPCIVKTVRRDHIHDGSFLARFLDEARVQAQLQHPGVAQVLEAATDEHGEPYTVVEYVEGRPLSDVRQRAIQMGTRISWPDSVAITIEVAQALAHVHERSGADGSPLGIVHRDLSPQNVMMGHAGEIKIIDFGTARGHNRRCRTVAGVVFAKPGYVAPEVARQQVGDGRIDLYALGVILWELCAGRRFLTGDPQQHLYDVAAGTVAFPALADECGAPSELDDVIAQLTKNDPDERFPRASVAVVALAKLLASAPPLGASVRGVRARAATLMRTLWPHEPARTRAEFVRLLAQARDALVDGEPSGRAEPALPAARGIEHNAGAASSQGTGQGSRSIAKRAAPADRAQLAGTPYRLLRTIGEGACGVVWEAEHVELGRRVAVKVLATEHASSPALLERFRREARAVAGLSHPNLVQVLDFGTALDGRVFLAMELVGGETLESRLGRGAIDADEAARIAAEACEGLAAAHAAGIVHRDINPQNLMLARSKGAVKLLDFGVATALQDGSAVRPSSPRELSLRGFAIFGTPEYMAPEQVTGEAIDPRTDVYALGCVLYEMLVGKPPFEGSSVEVMGKQLRDVPQWPSAGRSAFPKALATVAARAMAKDPRCRFPSAAAMGAALKETRSTPNRRRTHVRNVANGVLIATGMLAAGAASAHWAAARLSTPEDAAGIPRATSNALPIPLPPLVPPIEALAPRSTGAPSASPAEVAEPASLRCPSGKHSDHPRLRAGLSLAARPL